MKRIALLFLFLLTVPVFAQQVVRPSTCDYRYDVFELPAGQYQTVTNWFIDLMYRDLQQGRTYRRQVSEDGNWRFEGAVIVVPEIPGATASFSEGINIHPSYLPTHYFRLTVDPTNAPAMRQQFNLVMADQPASKRIFGFGGKKKFKKEVVIKVPPSGVLKFTPKKSQTK